MQLKETFVNPPASIEKTAPAKSAIAALDAKKGELCCYIIYQSIEKHAPEAVALVKTLPRFRERNSIERNVETFGHLRVAGGGAK